MYETLLELKLSYYSYCFSRGFFKMLDYSLESSVKVKILQAFFVVTGIMDLHKHKSCLYSFD